MPVTFQGNQYWPRYQADQLVTTMVLFIKLPISWKPPIDALVLGSSEALVIPLRMSLEQPQGD